MNKSKPNILLIQSDKHRFDSLAVNGNKIVKTPNLDKLATDGMNFTHSFCPIPLTAVSETPAPFAACL